MNVTLLKIVLCIFLSGFAALLYQVAWLRQFSIVFGTSEIAVATVLAAYMGGLAVGSAITSRYLHRINRPIMAYGLLEGGIALTALLVPMLLAAASATFVFVVGGQIAPPASAEIGQTVFYLVAAFLILGLPTGFMGATLPLLTKYAVRSDDEIGSRVSLLYATNTAGAVAGALVAGFLVLPALGLSGTVWVGAAVNMLVLVIAYRMDRQIEAGPDADNNTWNKTTDIDGFVESFLRPFSDSSKSLRNKIGIAISDQPAWILPIVAISGANAFVYEVLWTRLLNHVLGGSIYAFSTMLASFLGGIAIGGGIAGRFASDRQGSAIYFTASQVLIAIASIFVFSWIEYMVPESGNTRANAVFAVIVMLPSTIFIGATFPLAVRILSANESEAGQSAAKIYAWNTAGAIVGALLAGFYIIPELGFSGTIKGAALVSLVLALVTAVLLADKKTIYGLPIAISVIATFLLFNPTTPHSIIRSSTLPVADASREKQLFFEVGRSSTVLLVEQGGSFTLRTNGLPEAKIFAKGAPPVRNTQKWLTALPVIARPNANTMLVIGFGGGVAIEGIPPSVSEVDVIELEPKVIAANKTIKELRAIDPTAVQAVNIIINDARNALNLTSKMYDVIVSQPSHPWTAGASHLFTRQFLLLSKEHLGRNGIFVQWMNSELLDEALLKSLAATVSSVFDNVRLYHAEPGVLFFLASDSPVDIEQMLIRSGGRPLTDYPGHYSGLGINSVEDVLLTLVLDEEGLFRFSEHAELVTDNDNKMATRSKVFGTGLTADELTDLLAPYDPLLNSESWVFNSLGDVDYAYMASAMLRHKFTKRVSRLKEIVPDKAAALLINAMELTYAGREDLAEDYYLSALLENPDDAAIRYMLISRYLGSLAHGNAPSEIRRISDTLVGVPAAVIQGWKYGLARDWRSLAQLESELVRCSPTDPWYADAAKLRAEWRTKVVVQGENRFARDAMMLVDRALLIDPSLDLYVLRASSAILLQDYDATVESMRHTGNRIQEMLSRIKDGEYHLSNAGLTALTERLNSFISELDKPLYSQTDGADEDVRAFLEKLLNEIHAQVSRVK